MNIFFKHDEPQSITEEEVLALQELKKDKLKTFHLNGKTYAFNSVRFIGDWCHNETCNRFIKSGVKAHPIEEICDYSFTGACSVCSKPLWERDREYSVHKLGGQYCRQHAPKITVDGAVFV